MPERTPNWTSVVQDQIAVAQSALLTMTDWARAAAATPEQVTMLLQPYREMLEALYERELPLAELADSLLTT
ncbi:MAG TPA: hypothetical protein VJN18_00510 [Polyangiaceae bacterium]|nr:hypothetical protein [Polyangiaceae bacterium]